MQLPYVNGEPGNRDAVAPMPKCEAIGAVAREPSRWKLLGICLLKGGMKGTSAIEGAPVSFDLFNEAGRAIPGIHFWNSTKVLEMTGLHWLSHTSKLDDFPPTLQFTECYATLARVTMHLQH